MVMSPGLANVFAAAESLSIEERRELIDLLLEGLENSAHSEADGGSAVLSEGWQQEVIRRSAENDAGQAETVSWPEVQARWQSRRARPTPEKNRHLGRSSEQQCSYPREI